MADVMTQTQRSRNMSRIRGKSTTPELILRKKLWSLGLRYRLHVDIPGKPDIVFMSKKLAVFVDGCFWHGCPIHSQTPKTNQDFWKNKLEKNLVRDKKVSKQLQKQGWKVLRFWEHEVKKDASAVVSKIKNILN